MLILKKKLHEMMRDTEILNLDSTTKIELDFGLALRTSLRATNRCNLHMYDAIFFHIADICFARYAKYSTSGIHGTSGIHTFTIFTCLLMGFFTFTTCTNSTSGRVKPATKSFAQNRLCECQASPLTSQGPQKFVLQTKDFV